jgi:hypothetical protein
MVTLAPQKNALELSKSLFDDPLIFNDRVTPAGPSVTGSNWRRELARPAGVGKMAAEEVMPDSDHPPIPRERLGRWSVRVGLVLAVLVLVQFGTYFWLAKEAMPRAGITHLADYKGIHNCEFAAVGEETWGRLSPGQRATLERELSRHVKVIYHSADAIPDSSKHFWPVTEQFRQSYEEARKLQSGSTEALEYMRKAIEAGRELVGLKGGMEFNWKLEGRGPFWMRCTARCYMSHTGAEQRTDLYIWVLGRWFRVWNYGHAMA